MTANDGASRPDLPDQSERGRNESIESTMLKASLAGVPELEQFDSERLRNQALKEIAREAGDIRSPGYWIVILLLTVFNLLLIAGLTWLLGNVAWPFWVKKAILVVIPAVSVVAFIRYIHRSSMPMMVRSKLREQGVPVCMACGYNLRGLPIETSRCPECGKEFDEQVREILSAEKAAGGGKRTDAGTV